MPLAALFLAVTTSIVAIEGDADCPTAEAVNAELLRILPAPENELGDRASVTRSEQSLHVTLRGADGSVVGERAVVVEGTCEEQARVVAVILAAWLTDAHPEFRTALPVAPAAEPLAPEAPKAPPVVAPAPPAARAAPPAKPRQVFRWSAGAGAGVELSDAGAVAAFELSASFAPAAGWGATAFALFALPATRELGSGSAVGFRWPFGVGPLLRSPAGALSIELTAGPHLGWLHMSGKDFASGREANDLAFGVFAGARVTTRRSFLRPFLALTGLGWLSPATLTAQVPEAELELSPLEGAVQVGVSLNP